VTSIRIAATDTEIRSCFAVMSQLRSHLAEPDFVRRIRQQQEGGYTLVFLAEQEEIRAAAGFRILENLASGRVLYVDDLVTDAQRRSGGHGGTLFDWLLAHAREQGCDTLELDSGVQRFDAHRFYLLRRMSISSHHFRFAL
jgi:GNAT superfamily N-acetyltransferase